MSLFFEDIFQVLSESLDDAQTHSEVTYEVDKFFFSLAYICHKYKIPINEHIVTFMNTILIPAQGKDSKYESLEHQKLFTLISFYACLEECQE